ncbi:hypothetical protein ETAA8_59050 [Anatilimnocola aggregata]|uniref:Uncharacterized protein n=1 Tax=Anatilimnocola aggregata TaxID=2528021 RepID=A0A517YKL5_9BACT|nr:hypothetical protein [Anatilimnocola aggregata]QDU30757.1 hypothetical protein ETAA8_59050 [Anatilimnocola aggregata]
MKLFAASVCLFTISLSAVASAQEGPLGFDRPLPPPMPAAVLQPVLQTIPQQVRPGDQSEDQVTLPGVSSSQMTPEMYLYLHELKRHDDPKQAVRRKAELKTAQRMQRLAAQKWFGVSNARPMASAQPFMDLYSPRWIGNSYNAMDWAAVQGGPTVLRIETQNVQR